MMGWAGIGAGRIGAAAIAVALIGVGLAGFAVAQEAGTLGGFRTNPDEPIEVEADSLEVEDAKQTATFIGNVRVVQGDIRMKSDRLTVFYAQKNGGGSRIDKIAATGNVLVSSPDSQSASGEWANYLVTTRQIEMGNAVVLRQGENVIRGSRLFVDLNSGKARVVGGAPGAGGENGGTGRVKGLFQPSQN
ncbi:MAG: lipopolysaccharide transport periplasmic protein LptA [Parvibaculum sp.]